MQYQLSRLIAGPLLRGLWRPRVVGAEHIPDVGGAILASNHMSVMDSVFLPLMLKRPVTFAAKSEYFTSKRPGLRLMGLYLRATGQLSVDRAGARAAQEMLEKALVLLRDGELFGIYPEGTRSPDGRLYRARPGVGWLAVNSGLPVIPVAMIGTDRVLPPGRVIPRLGRVEIRIGKPMTFGDLAGTRREAPGKARRAIADEVVRAIQELSGQEYVAMYASARKEELAAGGLRCRIRAKRANGSGARCTGSWGISPSGMGAGPHGGPPGAETSARVTVLGTGITRTGRP